MVSHDESYGYKKVHTVDYLKVGRIFCIKFFYEETYKYNIKFEVRSTIFKYIPCSRVKFTNFVNVCTYTCHVIVI